MPRHERFTVPASGIISAGEAPSLLLQALLRRPAWHRDALCREYPDVDFFDAKQATAAAAICDRCLVAGECAASAAQTRATAGVWGGVNLTQPETPERLPLAADASDEDRARWHYEGGMSAVAVARMMNSAGIAPPPGDIVWRSKHVKALAAGTRTEPAASAA